MLIASTAELVRTACEEFDRENQDVERALAELFHHYPENRDFSHVLLKAVALNSLYSTQIPMYTKTRSNILDVASHIHQMGERVDSALAAGSPEIVDAIADVRVLGKKNRHYFSFAAKYCSWHKPESYPIFDSRVDWYVWQLRHHPSFAEFFYTGEEHWRYSEFRRLITVLRDAYGLSSVSFKAIDKFLWKYGKKEADSEA